MNFLTSQITMLLIYFSTMTKFYWRTRSLYWNSSFSSNNNQS